MTLAKYFIAWSFMSAVYLLPASVGFGLIWVFYRKKIELNIFDALTLLVPGFLWAALFLITDAGRYDSGRDVSNVLHEPLLLSIFAFVIFLVRCLVRSKNQYFDAGVSAFSITFLTIIVWAFFPGLSGR